MLALSLKKRRSTSLAAWLLNSKTQVQLLPITHGLKAARQVQQMEIERQMKMVNLALENRPTSTSQHHCDHPGGLERHRASEFECSQSFVVWGPRRAKCLHQARLSSDGTRSIYLKNCSKFSHGGLSDPGIDDQIRCQP